MNTFGKQNLVTFQFDVYIFFIVSYLGAESWTCFSFCLVLISSVPNIFYFQNLALNPALFHFPSCHCGSSLTQSIVIVITGLPSKLSFPIIQAIRFLTNLKCWVLSYCIVGLKFYLRLSMLGSSTYTYAWLYRTPIKTFL